MSLEPAGSSGVDVAIVGGGAAGVLVAIRLLSDPASRLRIAIIEPAAELARGAAYATTQPAHLLNVTAGRMSALAEDPGHFVRFLSGSDDAGTAAALATGFAPRRDYGRYLGDTLRAQPRYPALQWLQERATDIERRDTDSLLTLASGATLAARAVVLAVGNTPRRIPAARLHGAVRLADAWNYEGVAAVPADADVCIIGSGLSMVDAVLSLVHGGHRGCIHVLSRHGLMPLAHAATGGADLVAIDGLLALGLRERLRRIRAWTREATAAGEPWQWVFDRLRPHGQALWRSLGHVEQQRFLRHLVRYWDIHRHRIAPQVAQTLGALRERGRLEVLAGRLQSVAARADGGLDVRYRPRHADGECAFRADWLINATGVETHIDLQPDTLLGALRVRGRVLPGPHGIGIASEEPGRVLDARGQPDPGLFVLGAMRIGTLWESLAIPELRGQAQALADHLRATLDGRAAPTT
ncbi:FAD/NAD(P)-binding protein [Thermomonas fusca]|uniref:Pyridine nucleotide-disulfide oxidoreductase n=1 Tax=Thermomonas fusca TaxID=215690 RepID=A0A5R9PF47_9GAMM|nr:FAD/NAD(P)-binding protein [Thermomonas fusca]TLX22134.1 pyridine nucleotide-disulfide oxidoreductase [Thermomonas fusca]